MPICHSSISSAVRPVQPLTSAVVRCLFLALSFMKPMRSLDTSVLSSNQTSDSSDFNYDPLSELCRKAEGDDFLYTLQTQNDGCFLECIILTSVERFRGPETYFAEKRSVPHYLSGQPCRDSKHFCDRGQCIAKSDSKAVNEPLPFADLRIEVVSVLLNGSRNEDKDDSSLPDPFVRIVVADKEAETRAQNDTLAPRFEDTFTFANVSLQAPITFFVYDRDENFNDIIGFLFTTPATIVQRGWNGQLHFYSFSYSEGILATITYA